MIYTTGWSRCFAFGGIYAAGTFGWDTIRTAASASSWR